MQINNMKRYKLKVKAKKGKIDTLSHEFYINYINSFCNKCVWYLYDCAGAKPIINGVYGCPSNHKYKRDPPDGGYYG